MADRIEKHIQEGIQIGMNNYGTPYSIVVAPNGKQFPIQGAQAKPRFDQLLKRRCKPQNKTAISFAYSGFS
jgi:hypothetical protein